MRIRILALTAVNGEAVALTQPPGMPGVGEAHPMEQHGDSGACHTSARLHHLAGELDEALLRVYRLGERDRAIGDEGPRLDGSCRVQDTPRPRRRDCVPDALTGRHGED